MKPLPTAALLGLVFTLSACGGDEASSGGTPPPIVVTPPSSPPVPPPPPPPPPPPVASAEREITPNQTGTAFEGSQSPHIAITPGSAIPARGKLFLMLPGTGAVPRTYRLVTQTGPTQGYHAIGLNYLNDDAVNALCANSTDADCSGKVRREVITGENSSTLVNVDATNSIVGRLRTLLVYLRTNFPNEGWGSYLNGTDIVWSNIVAAGHSQGGGHAAYLGKLFSLDRIAMFSAPGDTGLTPTSPAPWLSLPAVTAPSRYYGFTHTADNLIPVGTAAANWQALGLSAFGSVVSVDGASAPFSNSRQLTSSAAPNPNPSGPSASPTHGAPVVDAVTPLDANGVPVYRNVWIYMAFS